MEHKEVLNQLLDLFDEMLQLAEEELEWFNNNVPGNGDTDHLLEIANARHALANRIDEKRAQLSQNEGQEINEELTSIVSKIMAIDNRLQIKATEWMQDLKSKMKQGKAARQANQAYGGQGPISGAAFFDGKR